MKFKNYYEVYGVSRELFLEENWEEKLGTIHQKLFLDYYPSESKSKEDVLFFLAINDGFAVLSDVKTREVYDEFLDLEQEFIIEDLTNEEKRKLYHLIKTIKEKRVQTEKITKNKHTSFIESLNFLDIFSPYSSHSNDTLASDAAEGLGNLMVNLGDVSDSGFSFLGDLFTIDF